MEVSLGALVGRLGGELLGDPHVMVRQIATLVKAGDGDLAFLANPKYRQALETSRAAAFILAPKAVSLTDRPRIVTPDPYLYFARAAQFFNPPRRAPAGIHPRPFVGTEQAVHQLVLPFLDGLHAERHSAQTRNLLLGVAQRQMAQETLVVLVNLVVDQSLLAH